MFSIALPLAPLLALANNLIEVRTDALKLLFVARRIPAEGACNIGPWRHAIKFISFAAIVVNLGYLVVTTDFFEQVRPSRLRRPSRRPSRRAAANPLSACSLSPPDHTAPPPPASCRSTCT